MRHGRRVGQEARRQRPAHRVRPGTVRPPACKMMDVLFARRFSLEIEGRGRMRPDVIGATVLAGEGLVLSVLGRILAPTLGGSYWGCMLFNAGAARGVLG